MSTRVYSSEQLQILFKIAWATMNYGCTIYVSVSLGAGAGNGTVEIGTGARGGFMVKLYIPVSQAKRASFAPENALVAY